MQLTLKQRQTGPNELDEVSNHTLLELSCYLTVQDQTLVLLECRGCIQNYYARSTEKTMGNLLSKHFETGSRKIFLFPGSDLEEAE